ncbi:MAG: phosphodiester glycosidase family protein [Synechococcales bacterium]|nr:phosphodiester glycosidase family protein [Synechococcales bacterium]
MGQQFRFKSRRGSSKVRSAETQWLGTFFCRICGVIAVGWLLSSLRSPSSAPLFQSIGSTILPSRSDQPAPLDFAAPPVAPLPEEIQLDRDLRRTGSPRPISVTWRQVSGVPVYITRIDLQDPATFISIGLANRAKTANSPRSTRGDEAFVGLVRHHRAALTLSGTFFSMDRQKRVMGNMVAAGQFLKYSPWENYGTTLGLRAGNRPEMTTARVQGKPQWQHHWFSLTAGPRLLWQGKIQINPKREGFTDPAVMGVALRSAIGFPKSGQTLLHVTFLKPISLQQEAQIMRDLGCYEAMNLDGGTSVAIARGNRILKSAGRELTNVITVYDVNYPAPKDLRLSWYAFQNQQENFARK